MTKRAKLQLAIIETREEMEAVVGEISTLLLDRESMEVEMNQRMQTIRAEYEARLLENDALLKEKLPMAKDWSERNRDAFGDRKTLELVHGTAVFRTGMPALRTVSGWTWEAILKHLRNMRPEFIRTKEEVDKETILTLREELGDAGLRAIGLKVVQAETFEIKPRREEVPVSEDK